MVVALEPGDGYPQPRHVTTTATTTSPTSAGAKASAGTSGSRSGSGPVPTAEQTAAWNAALAQAKANSAAPTTPVAPNQSLTAIANMYGVSVSTLEKDNPEIHPPEYLIYPGERVNLPKQTPAQVVPHIDNTQIKPIVYAYANAEGYDEVHDVSALYNVPPGALTAGQSDVLAQSDKNWNAVTQATYGMLISNNHGLDPNQAAAKEVAELDALEPGNVRSVTANSFAKANSAALTKADQLWTQNGIIAYSNYVQHPDATTKAAFTTAVDKALTGAANQAGSNPAARARAVETRAAYIETLGPQDPAFDAAITDATVNYEAGVVAQAYAQNGGHNGGAVAAADVLKAVTQNAGDPAIAYAIINASQGTIKNIAQDLGSLASGTGMPSRSWQNGAPQSVKDFNHIYADLSQAVAAANTLTAPAAKASKIKLSADGQKAADLVAGYLAQYAPNLQGYVGGLYSNAAEFGISSGDGAALSMATAAALQQQHRTGLATYVLDGIISGIDGLASQTSDDVANFGKTTATLYQLRTIWGPFMSSDQVAKATKDYLDTHTQVTPTANAELAVIAQDGDAIAEVASAWQTYKGQLDGVTGYGALSKAASDLTSGGAADFALSQSKTVQAAILAATLGGGNPADQSFFQTLLTSPVWSLPKSSRSFINAALKWLKKLPDTSKVPFSSVNVGDGPLTLLSVAGLALTLEAGGATGAKGFPLSSFADVANLTYTGLGIPKYTGEILSGLAKTNVIKNGLNLFGLSIASQSTLKGLTKTPLFKGIGSGYYGAGAFAAFLEAADDFGNHDYWDGSFSTAEGLGNFLNAAKPLFEDMWGETAAEGLAALGSGIGVAAVLGTLIYQGFKSVSATHAYLADSKAFLEDGLGISPSVAAALTAPVGRSNLPTVAVELLAYADANGMKKDPGKLLLQLNRQPADEVAQFLNIVSNIASGTLVFPRGGSEQITKEQGLQMLKEWANAIFGENQVG